ncbi:MAG: alpha/beta fold hydrolase [Actinophytocola sp.]|nr:alpha/beta fold hydrolase [Actinophytocola sp.]
MTAASQLSPHAARRTGLPGPYGPIAALQVSATAGSTCSSTALLVPGYTGSKEDFAPLLDRCAAAGFDTIAIDLPGQYESPGPHDPSAYLPLELGEVVAGLVERLAGDDNPVLLLGHSYGGLVARGAVLAGARVAGLTLLASGPAKLPDGPRKQALELGDGVLRDGDIADAYQVRESVSARNPGWAALPVALKEFLRTRFVASSPAGLLGMGEGLRTEPDRVDALIAALDANRTPRLVIAGANDDAWPVAEQRDMARRLDAEFDLVPAAAHSPNTEHPDALLDALLPRWRSWLDIQSASHIP